jgi:SAM-dependent methyltransferase
MTTTATAEFDRYAADYTGSFGAWPKVAGGSTADFAQARVNWLAGRLRFIGAAPPCVAIDFGCGTGTATPFLLEALGAGRVIGVDPSLRSLDVARAEHGGPRAVFCTPGEMPADESVDVVYCSGVFHHIPPADRAAAVRSVYRALRPGGMFALWENNPINPLVLMAMATVPLDRDAIPIRPSAAQALVRRGGFRLLGIDFLFLFPRGLRMLVNIEPALRRLPLGAQYQVLGIKGHAP